MTKNSVHISHCNQGDYEGSCKYGENSTCPMLADSDAAIKVGDLFWIYDGNNRHYLRDDGTRSQGPIYEKAFRQVEIIDETSRSWCIAYQNSDRELFKVPKKNPFGSQGIEFGMHKRIMDDKMKEDKVWDHHHGYKIRQKVGQCTDAQLREIARIVDYNDESGGS